MKTGKVSVIITTHYIEEARQANVVRARNDEHALSYSTHSSTNKDITTG